MSDSIEILRVKISEAFNGVECQGVSEDEMREFLTKNLSQYNTTINIGWIIHAGTVWNGEFQVQFNIPGDGWSSRWPSWAFNAARDALLHDKKIVVISAGVPFGPNLLLVLVTNIPL
jgi:hypothetical protein